MENNTQPSIRYNTKKVANRARGKRPDRSEQSYENLERRFELETKIHYQKDQFKNHWDTTRKEWKTWKALQSQTGLGFNEVTGTYKMPREWWIEFSKGHPGAKKFQMQPLYFEEELDILFGAAAARGEDSYVPTSGSSARGKRSFGWSDSTTMEDQEEYQFTEHQPYSTPTPSSIPPTSNVPDEATSPRQQSPLPPLPVAPKRQRTAVGQKLGGSIDRMCDILEMRTNLAYGNNDTVPKFADAMALVDRIPEIPVDNPIYFYALDMLRDPGNHKYYVVDAGYPNRNGFLVPYRNTRYHLPDFQRAGLRGKEELFNSLHSSLRNVIERSFVAAIVIHNFIIDQKINDELTNAYEDEMFPPSEGLEGELTPSRASSSDESQMSVVRDAICNEIAAAHGNTRPGGLRSGGETIGGPRVINSLVSPNSRVTYLEGEVITESDLKEELPEGLQQ
ncbi:hypothetical protein QJS04_geneDACA016281 [Acorus gramineus]|uniref:Myb/SANT-like domain-containing protein n=1 Tax=Acorus gramineus TaxID=55184 RepID=A0AAV9A0Z7_ACOGR|nr:hypothetical protein QJS04_geneDACA016281 [Acorus gramineus]